MSHWKNNLFEQVALYAHKYRPTQHIMKHILKYCLQTLCIAALKKYCNSNFFYEVNIS